MVLPFLGRALGPSLLLSLLSAAHSTAQAPLSSPDTSGFTVLIEPRTTEADVGERLGFKAKLVGPAGREAAPDSVLWFPVPGDAGIVDSTGAATFYVPGNAQVGALVGGRVGLASVTVKPAPVTRVAIDPLHGPIVVGGVVELAATTRTAAGALRGDVPIDWTSENPEVATVTTAGVLTATAPGRAAIRARARDATATLVVEVLPNPVRSLSIEPAATSARTGDVVRFQALALDAAGTPIEKPFLRWTVAGEGARVYPDGASVAERPGTYLVTAVSGDHVATASVKARPRGVGRTLEVVGRGPARDYQAAELWAVGQHVYLASIADRLWVYDVSDPARPVKTDSLMVDARLVNDVMTTPDGRIGVLTREGASNRRNGIVFFDASDPAHPRIVSEYTETVTGGVHSAYIDGHNIYLTDDATGSLRVIDFSDVKNPRQVARWEVESAYAGAPTPEGPRATGARYLHDIQVKDGLLYLAYWKDGLAILDVGNGIRGGSPESPQLVSRLDFDHLALYGEGWISGTHSVFRYKDYLFVGDEVLPGVFDIESRERLVTRGIVHVLDVSDVEHPREVAWYEVPEAGTHNFWVEDDMLYLGCTYGGGARVVDVSGELRGDLYAQGREIARLWTGDSQAFRPNQPAVWGAQPKAGLIFVNDINSGLWITRLGPPSDHGSTTAPGD